MLQLSQRRMCVWILCPILRHEEMILCQNSILQGEDLSKYEGTYLEAVLKIASAYLRFSL